MKIYIVTKDKGLFDEEIVLITNNLKEAYDYGDTKIKGFWDLKEYELDTRYFRRPEREEIK